MQTAVPVVGREGQGRWRYRCRVRIAARYRKRHIAGRFRRQPHTVLFPAPSKAAAGLVKLHVSGGRRSCGQLQSRPRRIGRCHPDAAGARPRYVISQIANLVLVRRVPLDGLEPVGIVDFNIVPWNIRPGGDHPPIRIDLSLSLELHFGTFSPPSPRQTREWLEFKVSVAPRRQFDLEILRHWHWIRSPCRSCRLTVPCAAHSPDFKCVSRPVGQTRHGVARRCSAAAVDIGPGRVGRHRCPRGVAHLVLGDGTVGRIVPAQNDRAIVRRNLQSGRRCRCLDCRREHDLLISDRVLDVEFVVAQRAEQGAVKLRLPVRDLVDVSR